MEHHHQKVIQNDGKELVAAHAQGELSVWVRSSCIERERCVTIHSDS